MVKLLKKEIKQREKKIEEMREESTDEHAIWMEEIGLIFDKYNVSNEDRSIILSYFENWEQAIWEEDNRL